MLHPNSEKFFLGGWVAFTSLYVLLTFWTFPHPLMLPLSGEFTVLSFDLFPLFIWWGSYWIELGLLMVIIAYFMDKE